MGRDGLPGGGIEISVTDSQKDRRALKHTKIKVQTPY